MMKRSNFCKLLLATAIASTATSALAGQITLFENPNYQGRYIAATDALPNIAVTGLNRTATSLVVGDGVWEACTEVYYHGQCARFMPGSYGALSGEFYGPIASVRQVAYSSNPSQVMIQPAPSAVASTGAPVVINPGQAPVVINPPVNGVVVSPNAPVTTTAVIPAPSPVIAENDTRIVLYQNDKRGARAIELRSDVSDLDSRRFDNRANAAFVLGGVWRLCDEKAGHGNCADFAPGRYATLGALDGRVRSAYILVPAREGTAVLSPMPEGRLVLYEYANFGGPRAIVEHGRAPDLDWAFRDRAESARVDSGTWLVCSHMGYEGDCRILGPGSYPDITRLMSEGVLSARQVWRPEYGAADIHYSRR
jgi:hypothetical protein